ncbi:MAG: AMP-binding protein [Candidatus Cloacimonetes bacterium]|nr:AMP-binding protein [Candidatus Cloacimonadota bacterium]
MLLHKKFIESVKKMGEKTAIFDQAIGKDISYKRMLIAVIILSRKFKRFPEEHIGVMLPTSAGCMIAFMALLMRGKIPVMINYSTGAYNNCLYAQEKCNFTTIITSSKLLNKINCDVVKGMIFLEDIMKGLKPLEKVFAAMTAMLPTGAITRRGSPEDTAAILFTSGSEKDPKAVQLSHKNLSHNISSVIDAGKIVSSDIFLGNLPLFHVFGLTVTFLLPIFRQCSIVAHANPLDYKAITSSIRKYKVTVMVGTPTFFHGYLKKAEKGDFDSVRLAITGADKLTRQIRDEYLTKHNLELHEGYGATETSPIVAVNFPGICKYGSVGKPVPGVQVKIVHRETGEILSEGEEGKILVKGDNVMKGYFDDIEETSMRIRNGWYDTGDMGVLDKDGYLWHRGRLKRFVKIAGEMVSLVKIESVLELLLPDETLCCVVDVPNPAKGSDVVAAITTKKIDTKQIKHRMRKELPSIAIPREFYVLDDLPMMGSGKVNFREVEKICRKLHFRKKSN